MESPEAEIPQNNYSMPGDLPLYLKNLPDRLADSLKGRKIFITGGTGFLGKVLIEKILRKAPDVGRLYLLVRAKKGKHPKHRLEELFASPIFDHLKSVRGEKVLDKVTAICGDVSEPDLAISPEDRKTLEDNVEIVFHSAATIRFDETLKKAVLLNTRGTMYMLQLAQAMTNLKVFVHISTAYCHLEEKVLEEKAYDPPADPMKIIRTCELIDEDLINSISKKILKTFPNTYAFTKSLSEGLVVESMKKGLPCIIVRPSVVIPIWLEPIPGWTDNINGPTGLLIGAGKGVLRTMYCDNNGYADYLPVDLCVNGILVSSWNYAFNGDKEKNIIHLTSSSEWQITWQEIIDLGKEIVTTDIPLNNCVWYPGGSMKRSRLHHKFCVLFYHTLPGIFLDGLLALFGYKPILARVHDRINKGFEVFEYYANNQWDFKNDNIVDLRGRLNERERVDYKIDGINMDVRKYFEDCILAARLYLLKEPPDTIPAARRHMRRMYWVDVIMKILFSLLLLWFFTNYSGTIYRLFVTFYLLIQHNIAFFNTSLDMREAPAPVVTEL